MLVSISFITIRRAGGGTLPLSPSKGTKNRKSGKMGGLTVIKITYHLR